MTNTPDPVDALSATPAEPAPAASPTGPTAADSAAAEAYTDPTPATPPSSFPGLSEHDMATMTKQLRRPPRGALDVAYRTPDGQPAVVLTAPRLDDGTPFPTLYYLTDPRLTAEASRLEVAGVMKTMSARLKEDAALAADYQAAHEHYLATRNAIEDLGTDFSGGGMPDRVKCLHVLIAYALAEGPNRLRLGTEAVALCCENNPALRGTAIPAEWPTAASLGTSMAAASALGAGEES